MTKYNHLVAIIFSVVVITISGCSGFEKIGSNLGAGVASKTKEIGNNMVDGALTRLNNGQEKEQLKHLLDSMISNAGLSANKQVVLLRDSIINDITTEKINRLISKVMQTAVGDSTKARLGALRDELLGIKLRMQIAALRNELLGDETNMRLQRIAKDAMASVLNDSVGIKIGIIRDTLLSSKTNNLLKAIIDTAMFGIAERLREDLNPQLRDNLTFIKKYATELLLTLAALAAGIVTLVWRNRQKYLKTVALLTSHIQNIPDQKIYDEITRRIKNDAVKAGVEPTLRTVLKDNGMLGEESWKVQKSKSG